LLVGNKDPWSCSSIPWKLHQRLPVGLSVWFGLSPTGIGFPPTGHCIRIQGSLAQQDVPLSTPKTNQMPAMRIKVVGNRGSQKGARMGRNKSVQDACIKKHKCKPKEKC